ncbi:uncharacterized protein LOC114311676 [Camellia sinensis]|uniref:uncharacterized protein LOC114311676 n=1 Tax=Camellia sinensis TaxID=4442 RepID=UPI001036F1EB|nr:uncharacterized protein LOC114311676 [Camellia sinensis]
MWCMIRFGAECLAWTCFLLSRKPLLLCKMRRVATLQCFLLPLLIALPWFLYPLKMESVCLEVLVLPLRRIIFSVTTAVHLDTHKGLAESCMGLLVAEGPMRAHFSDTVEPPPSASVAASVASPATDVSGLSASEFEIALCYLLDRRASTTVSAASSSSFANSGNLASSPSALLSHVTIPWIIDSGASDQIFGSSSLFSEYTPSPGQEKVRITDGTILFLSWKDLIHATSSLSLVSILHVLNFNVNLLCLSRITRDLNCSVIFFPDHCLFQDLITRKRIGSGREEHGLYILDHIDKLTHSSIQLPSTNEDLWLWHRRSGHPSFLLLRHLFPFVFAHNNVFDFQCESCQLGKQYKAYFVLLLIKAQFHFL